MEEYIINPEDRELESASFEDLNLRDEIMRAVREQGFTRPTPIQARIVPPGLQGRDILGSAETGSGKTAAFMLPVLNHLCGGSGFRCLVLEPTRELALQVKDVAVALGRHTGLKTVAVFGGIPAGHQGQQIRGGVDIIIATPGRLIDFAWMGVLDFNNITHFVVDEVDRMFDMGFIDDIKQIISFMPQKPYQKMGFSATLPPEVMSVLEPLLNNPVSVIVGRRSKPAEGITHELYVLKKENKTEAIIRLLKKKKMDSAIIFTETKIAADRLYKELDAKKFSVSPFHSGYDQVARYDILRRFRDGKVKILVATNVAARGLDITGISHVFNYEVPASAEDYVHRIGRSARADATGTAITLACSQEARYIYAIEKLIDMQLSRKSIEGLTLPDLPPPRSRGPRKGGPKKGGPRPGGARNKPPRGKSPQKPRKPSGNKPRSGK